MSSGESVFENGTCGGEVAAYVLGALEPAESEEFRRHVTTCAACADELFVFREVVGTLPMAAPQHRAPSGLRRRLLRRLRAEPKPAVPSRRGRPAMNVLLARRFALAGGVAAALAVSALVTLDLAPGGSSGVRVIEARVTGSDGRAELRIAGTEGELIVSRLPPPPNGRTYEVWLQHGHHAPVPSALFTVTPRHGADITLPGSLRGVSTVMVTQEPAGGSIVPTDPPVIVARVNRE